MKIGNVTIEPPVILAPMAGVTDRAFRTICRRMGCGMVCTEMISAKAIVYRNKKTALLGEVSDEERPVSLQLFGSDPDVMAEAAQMIDGWNFDILDINMGCPVPKVVKNGEGSALMLKPELAGRIIRKLSDVSSRPVTVKIRSGFDDERINAVQIAKIAEDNGAAAVAVHGRTREQYYSGNADWNIIKKVKAAVGIPVIGNGDIKSGADALRMREYTGCDAVMVGRAARGNPWIFKEINSVYGMPGSGDKAPDIQIEGSSGERTDMRRDGVGDRVQGIVNEGNVYSRPDTARIRDMILTQARMTIENKGEYIGIREMRKHVAWYTAGLKGSSALRGAVNKVSSYNELEELLSEHLY